MAGLDSSPSELSLQTSDVDYQIQGRSESWTTDLILLVQVKKMFSSIEVTNSRVKSLDWNSPRIWCFVVMMCFNLKIVTMPGYSPISPYPGD